MADKIENLRQRHQEDCKEYPSLVINLGFGLIKALVYVLVFSFLLVYQFNLTYLLLISAYAIISTMAARKIAYPLIKLNYNSQQAEATYRNDLSITNFDRCIAIMFGLAIRSKRLNYFQVLYGQLGAIIPILIVAPNFFNDNLFTLGVLMQATSIMGTVLDNLSFGVNSFDGFNRLLSCKKRLREVKII